MWTYGIVLVTGLIYGAFTFLTLSDVTEITLKVARKLVNHMMFLEAVDTLLVIVAILLCGRITLKYVPTASQRMMAWGAAVPILAIAIGANVAYHWAIREFTGAPIIQDELWQYPQLRVLLFIMLCIQPAIVEEFFMRYLFLGALNRYISLHGAVWISSVAFGMMHLGQPLSIPYLIVLGGVLGYLRVASGGLTLPILFHFAHNLVILLSFN